VEPSAAKGGMMFILFSVKGAFRCFAGKCNAPVDTNVEVLRV
jgi:hypothetical protein